MFWRFLSFLAFQLAGGALGWYAGWPDHAATAALSGVVASGPYRPTDQAGAVYTELSGLLKVQTDRLDRIIREDLERFNRQVQRAGQARIVPTTELPTPAPGPAMGDAVESPSA